MITRVQLKYSTNNKDINRIITNVVSVFQKIFTEFNHSYYLVGSSIENTRTRQSDVDIVITFKTKVGKEEENLVRKVLSSINQTESLRIDIRILYIDNHLLSIPPNIKAGKLLYGQDMLKDIPVQSIENTRRGSIRQTFFLQKILRRNNPLLSFPLSYPTPHGEFFGYEKMGILKKDSSFSSGFRTLISMASMMSTSMITMKIQKAPLNKRESFTLHKEFINNQWSNLLIDLYDICVIKHHYEIPENYTDRKKISFYCKNILVIENNFLDESRKYLLLDLKSSSTNIVRNALKCLSYIFFQDNEIINEVKSLSNTGHGKIKNTAKILMEKHL